MILSQFIPFLNVLLYLSIWILLRSRLYWIRCNWNSFIIDTNLMTCWRVPNDAHLVDRLVTLGDYLSTSNDFIIVWRDVGMRACWIWRAVFGVICLPTVVAAALSWLFLLLNHHAALMKLISGRRTSRWSIQELRGALNLLSGQQDLICVWLVLLTLRSQSGYTEL